MPDRTPASAAAVFREQQARVARRPYEALRPVDFRPGETADRILDAGWTQAQYPLLSLRPPVDWDAATASDRTWALLLHALEGLGPVLAAYDRDRSPRHLAFATDLAVDWVRAHPRLEAASSHAWSAMAVALRAYRLAYVMDALTRTDDGDDDVIDLLFGSLEQHRLALQDEDRFEGHSNHGIFQAAGQLAMATRLAGVGGMDRAAAQAAGRLAALMQTQFTSEGVHKEHSPEYHHAVLAVIQRLVELRLAGDGVVAARERIEDALGWFVMPDGSFAPFGDTDAEPLPRPLPRPASPHLRHVLTGGAEGAAPPDLVRGFPEAGYAVCRRLASGSYLAQMCGFHSRTHKHADHLSVVWQERGNDLLTDPGRYGYPGHLDPGSRLAQQGYWYSDPNRIYVESTRAHNAVEIDDGDHARRGVVPFGSALARHGESDGLAYVESQVRHPASVVQTRMLLYSPDRWLLVLDTLIDASNQPHRYTQRFQFGHRLELELLRDQFALRIPGEARRLYVLPLLPSAPLAPVRGAVEPELLGWVSRSARTMTPTWSVAYDASGVARHTFATLLALADAKPLPDHAANRMDVSGRKGRFAWRVGRERTQVDLNRRAEEIELRVRLTTT